MSNHNKLGALGQAFQDIAEARHIRLVEGGIHLVKQTEGRGVDLQQGKEKRRRDESTLSTGEEREILHLFARWLNNNLHTCRHIGRSRSIILAVFSSDQFKVCIPTIEECNKMLAETGIDRLKRCLKLSCHRHIKLPDN